MGNSTPKLTYHKLPERRSAKGKSITLTTFSQLKSNRVFSGSGSMSTRGTSKKMLSSPQSRRVAVCHTHTPVTRKTLKKKRDKIEKFKFDREGIDFLSYCQLLDERKEGLISGTDLVKVLQYTFKAELTYEEIHQILEESDSLHCMVDYSKFFVWLFGGTDSQESRYFVRNGMMCRVAKDNCDDGSEKSDDTSDESEYSVTPVINRHNLFELDNVPALPLPAKQDLSHCLQLGASLVEKCIDEDSI